MVIVTKFSQTSCLGLSFESIKNELWHLEGVDNFDTLQSLNIHVKIFLFCEIDEMSGCLRPKLGQKLVASGHIRQVLAY